MKRTWFSIAASRKLAIWILVVLFAMTIVSVVTPSQTVQAAAGDAGDASGLWLNHGVIRYNGIIYQLSKRVGDADIFAAVPNWCSVFSTRNQDPTGWISVHDSGAIDFAAVDPTDVNSLNGQLNCSRFLTGTPKNITVADGASRHKWFYSDCATGPGSNTIYLYNNPAASFTLNSAIKPGGAFAGSSVYVSNGGGECADLIVHTTSQWLFFPMGSVSFISTTYPNSPDLQIKSEAYEAITNNSTGNCKTVPEKMVLNYQVGAYTQFPSKESDGLLRGPNFCDELGSLPVYYNEIKRGAGDDDLFAHDVVSYCRFDNSGPGANYLKVVQRNVSSTITRSNNVASVELHFNQSGIYIFNNADFTAIPGNGNDDGYVMTNGISFVSAASTAPIGTGGNGAAGTATQPTCGDANESLSWLYCGILSSLGRAVQGIDTKVLCFMKIDTAQIFNDNTGASCDDTTTATTQSSAAYFKAWGVFRNISLALIAGFGLVMVIGQILGFEFLSALTLRKMLPAFIIAIICIPLTWPALQFVFTGSNAATDAIMAIIKQPFTGLDPTINNGWGSTLGTLVGGLALTAGAATYAAFLGLGGILSLVASGGLAVFSVFILLQARNVVADILILGSPVAVACYALGPFRGVFSFWWKVTTAVLLSVPAVGAVVQTSHEGAVIALVNGNKIAAIMIFIAGYGLVVVVFTKIDGAAGQIGDGISKVTGRARKGLSNYRSNTVKNRFNEAFEGRRSFGGPVGWMANRTVGVTRRAQVAGQVGGSWRGAAYEAGKTKIFAEAAAKMVEGDKGRTGGDDETMEVLKDAPRTAEDAASALMALSARKGKTISRAAAMGRIRAAEANFKGQVGTDSFAVAAHQALLASNTAYAPSVDNPDQAYEDTYAGLARQVVDGRITTTDAAAMLGSNKQRVDRAAGFGTRLEMMERAVQRVRQGQTALTKSDITRLRQEAAFGNDPGVIIGARHEALTQMAPALLERYQAAAGDYAQAQAAYDASPNDVTLRQAAQDARVNAARQAAGLANIYQYASYASEQKGRILADGVMGRQAFAGSQQTVQQSLDSFRGDPAFTAIRQEFAGRYGTPEEFARGGAVPPSGQLPPQ